MAKEPSTQQSHEPSTADAIAQLAAAIQSRNPSPLEQSGMSPERQAVVTGRTIPRRSRNVLCRGEKGALIVAHVVSDEGCPNGRIVWFLKYTHPDGMTKHKAAGGLVPDGMRIAYDEIGEMMLATLPPGTDVPPRACSQEYVLWRLAEFHKLDADTMVGKELKAHFCDQAGQGLSTPWVDSTIVASS